MKEFVLLLIYGREMLITCLISKVTNALEKTLRSTFQVYSLKSLKARLATLDSEILALTKNVIL